MGLTDGCIGDIQESVKVCELIKTSAPKEVAKPIMFFVGVGDSASSA
jgi:hypothetical protein